MTAAPCDGPHTGHPARGTPRYSRAYTFETRPEIDDDVANSYTRRHYFLVVYIPETHEPQHAQTLCTRRARSPSRPACTSRTNNSNRTTQTPHDDNLRSRRTRNRHVSSHTRRPLSSSSCAAGGTHAHRARALLQELGSSDVYTSRVWPSIATMLHSRPLGVLRLVLWPQICIPFTRHHPLRGVGVEGRQRAPLLS